MKKLILIVLTLLACLLAPPAFAEPGPLTLLISGSRENDALNVSLSPDGREYRIASTLELEAGGDICSHPEEVPTQLTCKATAIAGFEVNVGAGPDYVSFSTDIPIPVTVRGGSGDDHIYGGSLADKLIGGPGDDALIGRRGDDWILGGPGNDRLIGGQGNDRLQGGPGIDQLIGGPGRNSTLP